MKLILQNNSLLSDEQENQLSALGYEIDYYNDEKIDGEVYVGVLRAPYNEIVNIKGLKFIQSMIAGYDAYDITGMKNQGITFANGSGIGSAPIAEHVIHQLLDYYRAGARYRHYQANKQWGSRKEANLTLDELSYKKVLILGTGAIGQALAKRLKAFDVQTLGINSNGRSVEYFDNTFALDNIKDVLGHADVVVGALPLNDLTNKLYDKDFFELMQDQAIFINVGRGPQVVEADLLAALNNNLAFAALDVFNHEPLASDSKLWEQANLVITPHISSSSILIEARTKELIMENLENYILAKPIKNRII